MEYTLTKSKRKTISITVKDGSIFVRAPKNVSNKRVDEFVTSKEKWIKKHLSVQFNDNKQKENFKLDYGSEILLLGKKIPVNELLTNLNVEDFKNHDILVDKLKEYYRSKAKEILNSKVKVFSKKMGLFPTNVRITSAKTRWGSCSSKGNVNFSWYLVMADEDEIDYVVIHELAHLKEMNHSKRFWAIVANYIPDWKLRRNKLKELHRRLNTEKW